MQASTGYDLESVKLPRLAGGLLRLFASLLENPLTAPLLIGSFLDNAGVNKLRAMPIDDPPTFMPLAPVSQQEAGPPPRLDSFPAPRSTTEGFTFATVRDYAEAYRAGSLTPEQVAEQVLEAIAASDRLAPPLRAFIAVNREDVMRQARESSERLRTGKPLSIFEGVPVAVKDEVDMVPYPTTVGTRFLGRAPAAQDSTVVARIRAAGALLLGKANMHEIGITPTGLNPHHGTPRNPYNPAHFTGGSSSGPAAAVAAGLCPVAIGADGGGSIRIPASFCGIVGLKPTFGRVSEFGAAPLTWSLAHLGPLAATAEDAALAYAVLAGPDPLDPNSQGQPPVSLAGFEIGDLRGLKLGIYQPWFEHAASDVVAACRKLLDGLQSLGAELHPVAIPELDAARVAHSLIILAEMAANMDRHYKQHRRDFDLNTRVLLAMARAFTGRDYIQAQRVRTRALRHFEAGLQDVDVIVTPTTGITAPAIPRDALPDGESDASTTIEMMRFVFMSNFTGHPAISFPAGYDQAGMPIGLQVIGKPWQEHLLLRIARAAEPLVERRQPQIHYRFLPS